MSKVYAVAHAHRENGPNPAHTAEGIAALERISIPDKENITLVVVGTGVRFCEILQVLRGQVPEGAAIKYSPFCGSADGLDPGAQVVLAHGIHADLKRDYIGLDRAAELSAFNPWAFLAGVKSLTDGHVLLCTGGELFLSLGLDKPEKGGLYEIDLKTKKAGKVS